MINYHIYSENPYEHWPHFNCKGQNVLDLGCGRWHTKNIDEMTPFYFLNNGANKVVGVDLLQSEIDFYNNTNKNKNAKFVQAKLGDFDSPDIVKKLINDNEITAIKCDIEGHELFFLSFTREDYKNINSIAIEYHGLWIKDLLLSHFKNMGYSCDAHGSLNPEFGVIFLNKSLTS